MRPFLLVMLLSLAAIAEPLQVMKARTFAPSSAVKRVCVEVDLYNPGATDIQGAEILLRLTPDYRPANPGPRPVEGLLATQDIVRYLEPIAAGARRSVMLETPFFSRHAFSNFTPAFRVENLVPGLCESVTVRYVILIIPPPD